MRLCTHLSALLLVWMLSFNGILASERQIQSFDLEHRSATEVSEQLRAHLSPQVNLSHQGQRLILSGPADELDSLLTLIPLLDQPLSNYRVVLVRSSTNLAQPNQGRTRSTQRQQVEQLQLIEGGQARLTQDFYLPLTQTHSAAPPTQDYFHLQAGTQVQLQAQGQRVLLTFSTQQAAPRADGKRHSFNRSAEDWAVTGAESTLLVTLGQWIGVAAQEEGLHHQGNSSQRRSTLQGRYYNLCVEREGQATCQY